MLRVDRWVGAGWWTAEWTHAGLLTFYIFAISERRVREDG
jgi:hypothetical protein